MENETKIGTGYEADETSAASKVDAIYDAHKASFGYGFHSALWAIIVNGAVTKGAVVAFTSVIGDNGMLLGVATKDEAGYSPSGAHFKLGTTYEAASRIADDLNATVFGIDRRTAWKIVASSMRPKGGK